MEGRRRVQWLTDADGWWLTLGLVALVASWPASFHQPGRWWAAPVALAIVVLVRRGGEVLDENVGALGFWAAICASLAAMYFCVPETDQVPVVAVLLVSLALVDLATDGERGPQLRAAAVGTVLWSGLYGATARQGALIGALFAFLPLISLSVVASLGRRPRGSVPAAGIVASAVVAATIVARTEALGRSLLPALGVAAAAFAIWGALAIGLSRPEPISKPGGGTCHGS